MVKLLKVCPRAKHVISNPRGASREVRIQHIVGHNQEPLTLISSVLIYPELSSVRESSSLCRHSHNSLLPRVPPHATSPPRSSDWTFGRTNNVHCHHPGRSCMLSRRTFQMGNLRAGRRSAGGYGREKLRVVRIRTSKANVNAGPWLTNFWRVL
jgi:hypothetical protein